MPESIYGDLEAWWDEDNFLIVTSNCEYWAQLCEAFSGCDIAQGYKPRTNPFQGNGLIFMIDSKASADWSEIEKEQREYLAIWDEVAATRIEEMLKKAGKGYFALSRPRKNDAGELTMWLNPMEQHKYESGWYTIKQLEDWAKDKGPVMKGCAS